MMKIHAQNFKIFLKEHNYFIIKHNIILMSSLSSSLPDTQNQSWKNNKGGFGYRMLAKMGWNEGKGLGKNEDGMQDHIKVKKRDDTLGLGAMNSGIALTGSVTLSAAVSDYNLMLRSMSQHANSTNKHQPLPDSEKKKIQKKRKRSKDNNDNSSNSDTSNSDNSDSDSSSNSDNGKSKSKSRSKKGNTKKSIDSSSSSSSSSSENDEPSTTSTKSSSVRYITRIAHHKVLKQKNVAGYSAHDLKAIFGHSDIFSGGNTNTASSSSATKSESVSGAQLVEHNDESVRSKTQAPIVMLRKHNSKQVKSSSESESESKTKSKKEKKEKKDKKEKKSKKKIKEQIDTDTDNSISSDSDDDVKKKKSKKDKKRRD